MLPAALPCVFFVSQQHFYYTICFFCFCSVMFSSTLSLSLCILAPLWIRGDEGLVILGSQDLGPAVLSSTAPVPAVP